jgi:hypothetical protein
LAAAKEELATERNTVELLRGQITGLEQQIRGLQTPRSGAEVQPDQQTVKDMQAKITALEEYCLNVDHHNIPVPEKLNYLFTKTQGTYKWSNATYTGDLIRGIPSGVGKMVLDNGNTNEGQYVNGKKHGNIAAVFKKTGSRQECTWKYDKKDGISTETHPDGRVAHGVFIAGVQQHVVTWKHPSGLNEYIDNRDGKIHGHVIHYYTTEDYIVVYTYEAGEKQGKGKKYTYKEQVD